MSIRAEQKTHIYGEGTAYEQYALKDVSFEIEDGQFIGLTVGEDIAFALENS